MVESKKSYAAIRENRTLLRLFYLLLGTVIAGLLFIFRYYFWPFLFALIIYIALRTWYDKLKKAVRLDSLASFLMLLGLCAVVFFPVLLLLLGIAKQAFEFYKYIQDEIVRAKLAEWIGNNAVVGWLYEQFQVNRGEILSKVLAFLEQTAMSIFTNVTLVVGFSINFAMNFVFMLLILFFLFKDGYKLEEPFYRILPFPDDVEKDVVKRLKEVVKVLLVGNIVIMALQGICLGIGFFIVKISGVLLWASIGAIMSLIPVIGTMFIWIPATVFLIIKGSYGSAAFVATWSMAWYLILENILKPAIFGKTLNFHPLIFFFLLIGSIKAFGLAGILLGPLLLTLFYSLWEIYKLVSSTEEP
ncbi:MAG: AI-2E family transporter [Spirochaetes bacterium]|nr:AI-2E family transporter [Spirochaetota bacterium]